MEALNRLSFRHEDSLGGGRTEINSERAGHGPESFQGMGTLCLSREDVSRKKRTRRFAVDNGVMMLTYCYWNQNLIPLCETPSWLCSVGLSGKLCSVQRSCSLVIPFAQKTRKRMDHGGEGETATKKILEELRSRGQRGDTTCWSSAGVRRGLPPQRPQPDRGPIPCWWSDTGSWAAWRRPGWWGPSAVFLLPAVRRR